MMVKGLSARLLRIFLLSCLGWLTFPANSASAQLPDQFTDQIVTSILPDVVGITFDGNGQMYAWQKGGIVMVMRNDTLLPTPLVDISEEVGNWGDHGLLGFALDPDFLTNGHFYLGYVVDHHYLMNFGTANYDPAANDPYTASMGRITRYTADPQTNFTTLVPNSRKILLGESPGTGVPILHISHGMGSLAFGKDGSLLASCGESSSFNGLDIGGDDNGAYVSQALADGILKPKEDVGAFRAQLVDVLAGKILRIDPETGDGLPSNPFYDSADPRRPASRVYALGFRNPFRFTIHPDFGSTDPTDGNPGVLYVGDVGGGGWEEINVVQDAGSNHGWPIYEGFAPAVGFYDIKVENPDAPNPKNGLNGCNQPYFFFQDLLQIANHQPNPVWVNPCDPTDNIADHSQTFFHNNARFIYNNESWNPGKGTYTTIFDSNDVEIAVEIDDPRSPVSGAPFSGVSSIGGMVYNGTTFPAQYHGDYFQGDYGGWIRAFDVDAQGDLVAVDSFHTNSVNPTCMAWNPLDGSMYYVTFIPNEIHKVTFGGNPPPQSVASADIYYGPSPLPVNFSSAGSIDPLGDSISFHWDFGDGGSSMAANPSHTFQTPDGAATRFDVVLTVRDSAGQATEDSLIISLNNTPPVVQISSLEHGQLYQIEQDTELDLYATVSDAEHVEEELSYHWETFLHHNTHYHPHSEESCTTSTFLISPIGCGEEAYWYRVRLEVRDAAGLVGEDEAEIFPWCDGPFVNFLEFEGDQDGSELSLEWVTNNELNMSHFELLRGNGDGAFTLVGTVSAENTSGTHTYGFQETDLEEGAYIYKLRAVNRVGAFSYSEALPMDFLLTPEVKVFPNPVNGTLNLRIPGIIGRARFGLYDLRGIQLYSESWRDVESVIDVVDLSELPEGVYIYKIFDGSRLHHGRLHKLDY